MKKIKNLKKYLGYSLWFFLILIIIDIFSYSNLSNNYIDYSFYFFIDIFGLSLIISYLPYLQNKSFAKIDKDKDFLLPIFLFTFLISLVFSLIYFGNPEYYVEKAKEDKKVDVILYNSDRYKNEKDYLEDEKVIFYTKIVLPKDKNLINILKKKYEIKKFKEESYVKLNEKFSKQKIKYSTIYRFYTKNKINDLTNDLEKEMKDYLLEQIDKKK